jgi:hypothetical protein
MYFKNADNFFENIFGMQLSVCELVLFTFAPYEPSLWGMADKRAGLVVCSGFRTGT